MNVESIFDTAQLDFDKVVDTAKVSDLKLALENLDEKLRTAIVYQYFYGLTVSEISAAMGIGKRTADKYISLAKSQLADMLEDKL